MRERLPVALPHFLIPPYHHSTIFILPHSHITFARPQSALPAPTFASPDWRIMKPDADQCNVGMWEYENEKLRKCENGEMRERGIKAFITDLPYYAF